MPHVKCKEIVLSISSGVRPPKELVIDVLQKFCQRFIIADELGNNAHPHWQCALSSEKPIEPSDIKTKKLRPYLSKFFGSPKYPDFPEYNKYDWQNIKVFESVYKVKDLHYGYCTKEKKYEYHEYDYKKEKWVILTFHPELEKLYQDNIDVINKAKQDSKSKYANKDNTNTEAIIDGLYKLCVDTNKDPSELIDEYIGDMCLEYEGKISWKALIKGFTGFAKNNIIDIIRSKKDALYRRVVRKNIEELKISNPTQIDKFEDMYKTDQKYKETRVVKSSSLRKIQNKEKDTREIIFEDNPGPLQM